MAFHTSKVKQMSKVSSVALLHHTHVALVNLNVELLLRGRVLP